MGRTERWDKGKWNRDVFDRTTDGLAPVRDLDWEYTAKLARPVYDRWAGMSREYVWTDDAACNTMNPELFQMSQASDPGLEGIGTHELRKFNEMKFEQAKKVCEGCPVRATCLKRAEESDLYWSVRGGQKPLILTPLKSGGRRKPPLFPSQDFVEWSCSKHGRDAMMFRKYKDGSRPYCGTCSNS